MRNFSRSIRFDDIAEEVTPADRAALGPLELEGIWRVSSPNSMFGGFSALTRLPSGSFRAYSDRNVTVKFTPPDRTGPQRIALGRAIDVRLVGGGYAVFDVESANRTPRGETWLGLEADTRMFRIASHARKGAFVSVPEIADWPINGGVEALVRLADGRWLALCESCGAAKGGLHLGLLFPDEPGKGAPERIGMTFTPGFDPVDATALPDGRVLILTRRLAVFPPHFSSEVAVADPAEWHRGRPWPTHTVARIDGRALRENYEGMLVEPTESDQVTLWLISDANFAALQETRLLKLRLDPARLN